MDKSAGSYGEIMANRVIVVLCILSTLWWACVVVFPPIAKATETVLTPLADSYVASDHPDANYGQSPVLYVHKYEQESADAPDIEDTWLKFNLSTIPQGARINSITLRIHTDEFTSGFTNKIGVFTCEDDSWTESGITWNNSPMTSSTQPLSTLDIAAVDRDYDINVTSIAEDRLVVTLILKALKSTNLFGNVAFESKEGSVSILPLLLVDYESPSPAPDLMMVAVIAGTAAGGLILVLVGRVYLHRFPKKRRQNRVHIHEFSAGHFDPRRTAAVAGGKWYECSGSRFRTATLVHRAFFAFALGFTSFIDTPQHIKSHEAHEHGSATVTIIPHSSHLYCAPFFATTNHLLQNDSTNIRFYAGLAIKSFYILKHAGGPAGI